MDRVTWELIQTALSNGNESVPFEVAEGDEATVRAVAFLEERITALSAECNSTPAKMVYSGVAS